MNEPKACPVPGPLPTAGPSRRGTYIVGIGASAGGLEALEKLFAAVPLDTGMAFVVVQHLSPDFESHMDRLLGRVTSLPIQSVTDGLAVEPDHVYLIPPGMEMVISNGRLLLSERGPERKLAHPIDQFLRALSQDAGRYAVAVILSGTGSDGSRGIADIHAGGGLVIAQDPASCKFDAMPRNAQETGRVHLTLQPEAIGQALLRYARDGASITDIRQRDLPELADGGIREVLRMLQRAHGIDFGQYKASTVSRRVQRRVDLDGHSDLNDYVQRLRGDSQELNALYKDLLIGVTQFFRDPEAYAKLEQEILPAVLSEKRTGTLRVWSCGCATGEEAYSLAMLLSEATERLQESSDRRRDFKVFATDAHKESLQSAASGIYSEEKLEHVSPERRERFFEHRPDGYHVRPELRRSVVFAPHNVISDPPFTQMDLVACRNLLIYFQSPAQRKILSLLHFALRPSGILWLGPSESPGEIQDEFETLDGHWKVYRKRRDVRLPIDLRLSQPAAAPAALTGPVPGLHSRPGNDVLASLFNVLLHRAMPPSVVVNERFEILHSFEGASRFLRFPTGRPTANLLDVVYPALKTTLAGALQHALKERETVRYAGIPTPDKATDKQLRLVVDPVELGTLATTLLHVVFEVVDRPGKSASRPQRREADSEHEYDEVDVREANASRIEALEEELEFSRQNLQATIEELETSNEELQATNEELVASNEELQSTNEELHSVNEELHTVNAEHQRRLAELDEANADMENLLASTRVGVIFLDRELRIRRFTPEVAKILSLERQDLGRGIRRFVGGLGDERFCDRLEEVLRSGSEQEWEIVDESSTTYLVRALPYRIESGTAGVVVALIDVESLKQAQQELRLLSKSIQSISNGIVITDARKPDNSITFVNEGFLAMTGYEESEVIGRNCRFLQGERSSREAIAALREAIEARRPCTVLIENYRKDGSTFWNDLYVTPVADADGTVTHFVGIQNDVTERVLVGEAARANQDTIRLLLDSTAEGIFGLNESRICTFCNQSAARMFGYERPDEVVSKSLDHLLMPDQTTGDRREDPSRDGDPAAESKPAADFPIYESLGAGEPVNRTDQAFRRRDGTVFPVEYWSHPILRDGQGCGAVITFVDITERLEREREVRQAREQADLANAAKSRFLANMSHELRTPLTAILGFTDILREDLRDNEAVTNKLSSIRRNGDYLLRLLNDLLDLSAIEAGKTRLQRTEVPLREWLDDLHDVMQMRARESDCRLRFEYPRPLPVTITTDPARLRQVMVNLISNALKFAPEGESVVTVALEEDSEETELRLTVEDNGIGIPDNRLSSLFEPFTQATASINSQFGGTGLGLSICRRLVESLGGQISVDSTEGVGTRFELIIPVAPIGVRETFQPASRYTQTPDPLAQDPHTESLDARVLVADDMRDIRFIAKHFLTQAGCRVTLAEDGAEAVKLISEAAESDEPFDLVLMDMQMPRMDGREAVQTLRQRGFRTPIVALTADAMKGTRQRVLECGFDEYLPKPLDVAELRKIAQRLVDSP